MRAEDVALFLVASAWHGAHAYLSDMNSPRRVHFRSHTLLRAPRTLGALAAAGDSVVPVPTLKSVASVAAAAAILLLPTAPSVAAPGMVAPWAAAGTTANDRPVEIPYSTLVEEVTGQQVEGLSFSADESRVLLRTKDGSKQTAVVMPSARDRLIGALLSSRTPFQGTAVPAPRLNFLGLLGSAFSTLLQLAFPLFLLWNVFVASSVRTNSGPGGLGVDLFGKSRATLELQPSTGVTFADVAGCDEAKLELVEVVDFLKNTTKYDRLGAIAPRGVLLEGPPGTGKTLMARAIAGEAQVPFISATGSEFVEMFVGVGASRVRDIFDKAKKSAPCIIFIDEIDAVAKRRVGGSMSGRFGGSDEQEQTLNQILSEMDGFKGATGVVVIAATNRPDTLDPALLRPGRFDRRIGLDLPDRVGREAVLKVHARSRPLDASVDLKEVAARTTGFSGAMLANLLNEAAIVAARRDKAAISIDEVNYALDRVTVGLERKTGMASARRKELVAYHEAGHALMGLLTPGFDEVGKVTIVPRAGGAGGFTLFTPSDEVQDSGMFSRRYLGDQLSVALGGRVAEELAYGEDEVTTGAAADLQRVAEVARRMITQWGFGSLPGSKLGATAWEAPGGSGFGMPKLASERTQAQIDDEVASLVQRAYMSCKEKLSANRPLLDDLVRGLVAKETLDAADLRALLEKHGLSTQAPAPKPQPLLEHAPRAQATNSNGSQADT